MSYHVSSSHSLHHSLDLMSSPIYYIFVEPVDKICRDHHQHLDSFLDINWIHDEKYHSCPRWFVLSSTILLPSVQHKLVRVLCYTLSSLLYSICSSLPWSITISYVINVVRISPPLKNSWYRWYFSPSPFFLVLVLIPTGVPTSEWCSLDSALLATLLLWC